MPVILQSPSLFRLPPTNRALLAKSSGPTRLSTSSGLLGAFCTSVLNGPPLKAGSTYWLEAAAGTTYSEFWGFNLTGDTGAIAQSINGGAWNVSYHSRLGMRVGVVPSLWNVARGGSWATAANWTPAALPDGSGNTADFSWQTLAASATVTLDGSHTIGNLIFGDQGNAYNWTLAAGNGGTLTLQVSTGTPTITVDNQTATISAVLAGSQGLTTTGSGILALSGSNTYTGPTTISQGKLTVDGWLTNSAVNVSGGTLGGTGTFGSVSVNAGGHLAPGDLNSGASSWRAIWTLRVASSTSSVRAVPLPVCRSRAT